MKQRLGIADSVFVALREYQFGLYALKFCHVPAFIASFAARQHLFHPLQRQLNLSSLAKTSRLLSLQK